MIKLFRRRSNTDLTNAWIKLCYVIWLIILHTYLCQVHSAFSDIIRTLISFITSLVVDMLPTWGQLNTAAKTVRKNVSKSLA